MTDIGQTKILCIHASAGAGHTKAAEYIYKNLSRREGLDVSFVDALDHTSPAFKKLYSGTYAFLITKVPWLWAFFFNILNIEFFQPFIRSFRRFHNHFVGRKLEEFLKSEKFDYIISTHFMPNEVVSSLKREGYIYPKIISVITDYDVHKIWLAPNIDFYCVASEYTQNRLTLMDVPMEKIRITGIPTGEAFSRQPDISELKKQLGIKPDVFSVLIATGSFGIGPIEQLIKKLGEFQVLVVCGHNKDLFDRLKTQRTDNLIIFGHVDNMHELMAVSDAMVTKPGGLSITEALVSQLPLIFFNIIPGQEAGNVKVLREYGIGVECQNVEKIAQELKTLKDSKDKYITVLKKTKSLARPNAVSDIISLIR